MALKRGQKLFSDYWVSGGNGNDQNLLKTLIITPKCCLTPIYVSLILLQNTVLFFLTTGCVSKCEAKKNKKEGLFRATIILINKRKFNWRQPGTTFVIQVLHKTSTVNFQLYHIAILMPTKQNSWLKNWTHLTGTVRYSHLCSRCSRGDTAWPYCTTVSVSNEAKE